MSVDFKLMFVYHGTMLVLFATGQLLSIKQEIAIAVLLAVSLLAVAAKRRSNMNWRKPQIRSTNILAATGTAALMSLFLFAATPLFPPSDHRALPWYLAGGGLGFFGILSSLGIAYTSEAEFLAHCRTMDRQGREIERLSELPEAKDTGPSWKRAVRSTYYAVFFLVWLNFLVFFYDFGKSFSSGSPVPTSTQTERLSNHGKVRYITPSQKKRDDILQRISFIGIPGMMLTAAILQFGLKIRVFDNSVTKKSE